MPQIPLYRTQVAPATPRAPQYRAATAGYEALFQLGQTMQGVASEVQRLHLNHLARLKQATVTTEVNRAKRDYLDFVTGVQRDMLSPDTASVTAKGEDTPNYVRAPAEYERGVDRLWKDLQKQFSFRESEQQVQDWLGIQRVADYDRITGKSREYLAQVNRDNGFENLQAAVEDGDTETLFNTANSLLQAGTISQVEYDNALDEGYKNIAYRKKLIEARNLAQTDGYAAALSWLSDKSNLGYAGYEHDAAYQMARNEGKSPQESEFFASQFGEKELSISDQEQLLKILETDQGLAEKRRLEKRRADYSEAYNDYLDRFRKGQLTADYVFSDARSEYFDGAPFQLRQMVLGWLENQAQAALEGRTDPTTIDQPEVIDQLQTLYLDPLVPDEQYLQFIDEYTGQGISTESAQDWKEKVSRRQKWLNPHMLSGIERIREFYDEQIREAEKSGDSVLANQNRVKRQQVVTEYVDSIGRTDLTDEFTKDPEGILDQLATNMIATEFDDRLKRLSGANLSYPELYRDWIGRLNNAEELQRNIQDRKLFGIEDEYQTQLNQLEFGYRGLAERLIGRSPTDSKIAAGGQILLFYPTSDTNDFTAKHFTYGFPGNYFTFLEEGNDLVLKVWNGNLQKWVDPPKDMNVFGTKAAYQAAHETEGSNRITRPTEEINRAIDEAIKRTPGAEAYRSRIPGQYVPPNPRGYPR